MPISIPVRAGAAIHRLVLKHQAERIALLDSAPARVRISLEEPVVKPGKDRARLWRAELLLKAAWSASISIENPVLTAIEIRSKLRMENSIHAMGNAEQAIRKMPFLRPEQRCPVRI